MTPEERKAHRAEYMRKYREAHREQLRVNNRKYSRSEKGKERNRRSLEKHREAHKERCRAWYQAHREEALLKAKKAPKRMLGQAKKTVADMDKTVQNWLADYNKLFEQ